MVKTYVISFSEPIYDGILHGNVHVVARIVALAYRSDFGILFIILDLCQNNKFFHKKFWWL